ncbi:unnamed protein product [Meloidogyne enterolobii]|uniref:Uncharacterized protein n=1 Tax=Meloidogyne enterolobii TaxID=390850 RepID=A0ACB0ZY62_MELEN
MIAIIELRRLVPKFIRARHFPASCSVAPLWPRAFLGFTPFKLSQLKVSLIDRGMLQITSLLYHRYPFKITKILFSF